MELMFFLTSGAIGRIEGPNPRISRSISPVVSVLIQTLIDEFLDIQFFPKRQEGTYQV